MLTADSPARTESSARPPVWPVFIGFIAVYLLLNIVSLVELALGVGNEALMGTLELSRLSNSEVFTALVQELVHRPLLAGALSAGTSLVFGGYALAAGWVAKEPLTQRLRLTRPTIPSLLFAAAGLFALSELLELFVVRQNWMQFSRSLAQFKAVIWQMDGRWLPAALVIFALLPGVCEELFFRGFVQTRLTKRWGVVWSVLFSALLFGIAHSDPVHSPLAFVMGLMVGVVVEWTGSLWPAIGAHVANNALSILASLGYVQFNLPTPWKIGAMSMLVVTALLLLFPERKAQPPGARGGLSVGDSPTL